MYQMKGRYRQMELEMKKEKNFIYFNSDEANRHYYLDINDGYFYNAKTKRTVQIMPFAKKLYEECENEYNKLQQYYNACWARIIGNHRRSTLYYFAKYVDKYLNLIASFRYNVEYYYNYNYNAEEKDYKTIFKNAKIAKKVIEEDSSIIYRPHELALKIEQVSTPVYSEIQADTNFINSEKERFWEAYKNLDNKYKDLFYYYGFKQKYCKSFSENTVENLIKKYIDNCEKLGKEPIKASNGIREFTETELAVQRIEEEHNQKEWTNIYNKLTSKVLFEYGDYIVVLPEKPDDLVVEGLKMHHCVGSYISRVIEEKTYIVFVRRKNNLKVPYITAQISTNGKLQQYFLAYDMPVTSLEDKEFKKAYQNHLNEVWGK